MSTASIDDLVKAGRYADAAAAARAAGDLRRARELYERIWDFRAAAECALAAGDRGAGVRLLLDAKAWDEAKALAADLPPGDAADAYESRRLHGEAAVFRERLGQDERAAALYQKAGMPFEAARALERAGKDREAGRLYERLLAEDASSPNAPAARLALGRLLARLGQHQHAARWLQEAARDEGTRLEALRLLVVSLLALGLRDGARDALDRARQLDPGLPVDLDAMVDGAAAPARRAPPRDGVDETVMGGRYRLLRLLGAGGSGRVHLARDEVSGREVAVKLFFAAHARGQEAYERFSREARVFLGPGGRGKHPNIVEVLDFRDDAGFLVMELMSGGTLADRLTPRLAPAIARRAAIDVLAGLSYAHGKGIVHRDIKPANVFFDAKGTAKVGDFGVAHLLDLGHTQTGGLIGTLAYMAPEQITGAAITVAADLYAFAVTWYLALTGRLPFLGPDFVAQHLGETPPRPSEVLPALGTGWDEIVMTLLAKDPAARPPGADEVRRAIEALGAERRDVLVLPRQVATARAPDSTATSGPMPAVSSSSLPVATDGAAAAEGPRTVGETRLGETPISTLWRAVDTALSRSVVLERFAEGHPDAACAKRLLGIAAATGPHLQRVLAWDRATRTVVYEAPVGETVATRVATAAAAMPPREAIRILAQLARALLPLHASGLAHGAVAAERVLLDEVGNVTLAAAGLGPTPDDASPAADCAAALAVTAQLLNAPDLATALAPHLLAKDTPTLTAPDAATLSTLADRLDSALAEAEAVLTHIVHLVERAYELDESSRQTALEKIRARAQQHALPASRITEIVR